jgi:hypothetical protein
VNVNIVVVDGLAECTSGTFACFALNLLPPICKLSLAHKVVSILNSHSSLSCTCSHVL